jgi:hypothetical protein
MEMADDNVKKGYLSQYKLEMEVDVRIMHILRDGE